MAAEKGNAFVVKIGNGATSETFATVGGARTTSLAINNEIVDVTDKDSGGKRELLAAAGIQSMSVSGAGVFKDSASEALLKTAAEDQTIDNYQLAFADGGTYEGAFQVASLSYDGEYNGARMYSFTLESSGTITYT